MDHDIWISVPKPDETFPTVEAATQYIARKLPFMNCEIFDLDIDERFMTFAVKVSTDTMIEMTRRIVQQALTT